MPSLEIAMMEDDRDIRLGSDDSDSVDMEGDVSIENKDIISMPSRQFNTATSETKLKRR